MTTEHAPAPQKDPFSEEPPPSVQVPAFWRLLPSGMRRRWWLFRPLDLIARHFPTVRPRKGMLVVRMDGIGDMVLFRRTLDHYAAAFGVDKSDITILGCESWGRIADTVFAGYRVIAIDEHAFARRPLYRLRVGLMVRRLAPEIAVCDSYFRRAMMADSLVWISGAPQSVVSLPYVSEQTRAEFTFYLSQASRIVDTGPYPTHEIDRHYRFVSQIAGRLIPPEPPAFDWPGPRPDVVGPGRYAVMNPGSNEHGRRWPFSDYMRVAERLLAKGWKVVFVGTQAESWDAGLLRNFAGNPGVVNLTGRTSLPDLMDLMRHADLVVSNDTGPAHLSIAVGAPTVVIVGGGHFTSFVPYPADAMPANARFVYRVMDCYHCFWRCHKRRGKTEVFPCVSAVDIEQVWDAAKELMPAEARTAAGSRA